MRSFAHNGQEFCLIALVWIAWDHFEHYINSNFPALARAVDSTQKHPVLIAALLFTTILMILMLERHGSRVVHAAHSAFIKITGAIKRANAEESVLKVIHHFRDSAKLYAFTVIMGLLLSAFQHSQIVPSLPVDSMPKQLPTGPSPAIPVDFAFPGCIHSIPIEIYSFSTPDARIETYRIMIVCFSRVGKPEVQI